MENRIKGDDMGITIHYKGHLKLERIGELQDFMVLFCKRYGLKCRLVRSSDESGIIVDPDQGCDLVRFVFDRSGFMKSFTKTQFDGIKAHLKVIALLEVVRRKFIPDLQVHDEAGFWENRDFEKLREEFTDMAVWLDQIVDKLKRKDSP